MTPSTLRRPGGSTPATSWMKTGPFRRRRPSCPSLQVPVPGQGLLLQGKQARGVASGAASWLRGKGGVGLPEPRGARLWGKEAPWGALSGLPVKEFPPPPLRREESLPGRRPGPHGALPVHDGALAELQPEGAEGLRGSQHPAPGTQHRQPSPAIPALHGSPVKRRQELSSAHQLLCSWRWRGKGDCSPTARRARPGADSSNKVQSLKSAWDGLRHDASGVGLGRKASPAASARSAFAHSRPREEQGGSPNF